MPSEAHANCQRQMTGHGSKQALKRLSGKTGSVAQGFRTGDIDFQRLPAQDIDFQPFDLGNFSGLGAHQQRATRPGLADMPPLQVARIGNRGLAALDPVLVDVAQRPILVALGL